MAEFFLSTQDLAVGYNGQPLIRDIKIHVDRGEILTLIGPNGAGKSTILKSIIKQLELVGGAVTLQGRDMAGMNERDISRVMSVLMTDRVRPELMTCEDVVSTGRYPYTGRLGILSQHDREAVARAMELVHASELRDLAFDRISDGQRQRVLLARAICQEPEIIILDEPTSFLDVRHKLELLAILKQMVREQNVAVIMSLHELDLAQRISDKVVCVNSTGIECWGTPEEIFAGERIQSLYHIGKGSFYEPYGSVELEKHSGSPRVFVVGGGGSGIPVYRCLQRRGIPFACGVIAENDLDMPAALGLAAEIVTVPAFEAVTDEAVSKAAEIIARCEYVICPLPRFGSMNEKCRALLDAAGEKMVDFQKLKELL